MVPEGIASALRSRQVHRPGRDEALDRRLRERLRVRRRRRDNRSERAGFPARRARSIDRGGECEHRLLRDAERSYLRRLSRVAIASVRQPPADRRRPGRAVRRGREPVPGDSRTGGRDIQLRQGAIVRHGRGTAGRGSVRVQSRFDRARLGGGRVGDLGFRRVGMDGERRERTGVEEAPFSFDTPRHRRRLLRGDGRRKGACHSRGGREGTRRSAGFSRKPRFAHPSLRGHGMARRGVGRLRRQGRLREGGRASRAVRGGDDRYLRGRGRGTVEHDPVRHTSLYGILREPFGSRRSTGRS
jgi:hypothetical protein